MKFYINLSTRAKLLISFGIIWLFLAVVIVIANIVFNDMTSSEMELKDVNMRSGLLTANLRSLLNSQRTSILELLIITDIKRKEEIHQDIEDHSAAISADTDTLRILNSDQEFLRKLTILDTLRTQYNKTRDFQIALIEKGETDEARRLGTGLQDERFNRIMKATIDLTLISGDLIDKKIARNTREARSSLYSFLILGLIGLMLGILQVFVLNKTIVLPLLRLSDIVENISENSDFRVNIPFRERRDEIGRLGKVFKFMLDNLSDVMKDVKDTVNVLAAASSEILAASTQVATGAVQTAASITETSTTVEQVRQAAQLSSEKATEVAERAIHVARISVDGQSAVEETVQGMDHIKQQMDLIAQTVVRLSEQSQSIGGIIASVNDVADQSNLLAVNAAIEAAKAGEHGKGFAVVAQEIKSLAEQSKKATAQVRSILFDIQKSTGAAVMAAEFGNKAVDSGLKKSMQAGDSIKVLTESTRDAANVATQIMASSKQQLIGMDQIGVAIRTISQAGTENASSMKQVKQSAQDLNELGLKLKTLVEKSKL